ncbi:hypothetical protein CR513_13305, partial [Mucuna pruriens]
MDRSMIDTTSDTTIRDQRSRPTSDENQLTKLTSLVRQLTVEQDQPSIATRVCGICTSMEHPTDMCPTLQETKLNHPESVGAIGGY